MKYIKMFFLIVLSCLSTIQLVLCADSIDRERQRLSSKPVFYGEHFVSQKDRSIDLAIKRFNSSGMLIPERYRHMSQRDFVSYVLYGLKDKVTVAKKTLKSSVALDFFQQRYIRAISDEVFFIYSEDMRKCFYRIHGNDNLYKQLWHDAAALQDYYWDSKDRDAHPNPSAEKILRAFPAEEDDYTLREVRVISTNPARPSSIELRLK